MDSLDATYGAAFIGLIASAVLYGVTLLQTFLYYRQYPNDSWLTKFIVFFLWILDTAHLFLCTIALYTYLVTNFSNPEALHRSTWSMNLQTDCNGLIGLIVECFFARRLWIMSGNHFITGIIVILACIHFGLGVFFTVEGFILVNTSRFPSLIWVTSTGLGSAAAADIIIAASLCYYLTKSRTGFARTDSLIATLIIYSLTTGLITSVIAFIIVVTFATMPNNYVWLGFFWLIGKCYVNSLLAALNSRESLREQAAPQQGSFFQLTPFRAVTLISSTGDHHHHQCQCVLEPPSPAETKEHRFAEGQPLAVNVQTQTVSKTDYEYVISPPPTGTGSRF
ncbi:hypothetical protein GALMADRAFT_238211 [Galerina marginata CBS 339.88]|uniref:DUF6534 domain-containing protein n=1 Tax=Galerina marginata (strain CBS 339.88) TaxID=685588 RepID=A0A067TK46_GALM3|nr:hypothetical protein GALMADRAFT_238211 [Galerina marginata CBS 339.88]